MVDDVEAARAVKAELCARHTHNECEPFAVARVAVDGKLRMVAERVVGRH